MRGEAPRLDSTRPSHDAKKEQPSPAQSFRGRRASARPLFGKRGGIGEIPIQINPAHDNNKNAQMGGGKATKRQRPHTQDILLTCTGIVSMEWMALRAGCPVDQTIPSPVRVGMRFE